MGAIQSYLRGLYFGLKALTNEIKENSTQLDAVLKRIKANPGLPSPNPTASFWLEDPLFPELVDVQSSTLPDTADIVIIGSGITGASVARVLLKQCERMGIHKKVVMLEARQVTSGATGRNGGHIKDSAYEGYGSLKPKYGAERAKAIVEFRMRHLPLLVELAHAEGWSKAEARYVETVDLFLDKEAWEKSKKEVEQFKLDMAQASEDVKVYEAEEARKVFDTGHHVCGALSYTAGALWPYRLVVSAISDLLETYPTLFSVETKTPVTEIKVGSDSRRPYLVHTSRGVIAASHIVHATNAHAATLIPGLLGKIFPCRGQMAAQRPGRDFPQLEGNRSWSLIDDIGFEYITQRPGLVDSDQGKGGEIMLGGGFFRSGSGGMAEVGVSNDDDVNVYVGAFLGGLLPMVFGPKYWTKDSPSGTVKNMWTGILAATIDTLPFVGRLESTITKRTVSKPIASQESLDHRIPDPAEWIAAGYNGEGMVNAWLCGVAVAMKVLGLEDTHFDGAPGIPSGKVSSWLPVEFIISSDRLSRTSIAELATLL